MRHAPNPARPPDCHRARHRDRPQRQRRDLLRETGRTEALQRCEALYLGGDPDSAFVEVRAATKKTAVARAAKVLKNIKAAKVTPRSFDIYAFKGRKRVFAKTYRLKGKHWYYSDK